MSSELVAWISPVSGSARSSAKDAAPDGAGAPSDTTATSATPASAAPASAASAEKSEAMSSFASLSPRWYATSRAVNNGFSGTIVRPALRMPK